MNKSKFKELFQIMVAKEMEILEGKGHDYTRGGNADKLENFKRVGKDVGDAIFATNLEVYRNLLGQNRPDREYLKKLMKESYKLGIRLAWYIYWQKHNDRIITWVKTGRVASETAKESFHDSRNYTALGFGIFEDLELDDLGIVLDYSIIEEMFEEADKEPERDAHHDS